jgi:hypothetical protein
VRLLLLGKGAVLAPRSNVRSLLGMDESEQRPQLPAFDAAPPLLCTPRDASGRRSCTPDQGARGLRRAHSSPPDWELRSVMRAGTSRPSKPAREVRSPERGIVARAAYGTAGYAGARRRRWAAVRASTVCWAMMSRPSAGSVRTQMRLASTDSGSAPIERWIVRAPSSASQRIFCTPARVFAERVAPLVAAATRAIAVAKPPRISPRRAQARTAAAAAPSSTRCRSDTRP